MRFVKAPVLFVALVFSSVFVTYGQSVAEPGWYSRLEAAIKKTQPEWTIKPQAKSFDGISASILFRVEAGKEDASIDIFWPGFSDIPNAVEHFRGARVRYGGITASGTVERETKDYGDEAVIWLNPTGGWKRMHFRRDKATVEISGSAEAIIREVAAIIDAEIKKG